MLARVIEISTPGSKVSKYRGLLLVSTPDGSLSEIPLDVIDVLILHSSVQISVAAISALVESRAAIIICGKSYNPLALIHPIAGNSLEGERLRLQFEASEPLRKQLWKSIVVRKIRAQVEVLERLRSSNRLRKLSELVLSGDTTNVEAQAARIYWRELFGEGFRRDRRGGAINALLNYGYAILRSCIARSIAAVGLHPAVGIHHRGPRNTMALADDLMEPYRPLVDSKVYDLVVHFDEGLSPNSKAVLAEIPAVDLTSDGEISPVRNCALKTAYSLYESLSRKSPKMWYPEKMLPNA